MHDPTLVLVMPAAVGSFSFAAIQQGIKNPARGGGKYSLVPGINVQARKGTEELKAPFNLENFFLIHAYF